MVGAIIFVVVMALVVPVAIMFGGAIWSGLFGWYETLTAQDQADAGPTDAG
jgi:hypothetical protein